MRAAGPPTVLLTVLLAALFAVPVPANAIPVFARKYATSCQTCHVAFPKLTPFGDAFRRNGYRFPGGEDEDNTEEDPVPLGHEAHKRVFPDAVWPGLLPGAVPLSVQVGMAVRIQPEGDPEVSFANVGGNIGLNFAATFDDTFSAWAGAGLRADTATGTVEAELERVFLIVNFLDEPALNLRVGRFESGASAITSHRTLGFAPWFMSTPVGDNGFTMDPTQVGLELTGVFGGGHVSYAAGYVEGSGNTFDIPRDVYGRLGFKLGGMSLDGLGGAEAAEPWRETSLQAGAFAHYGQATIGDPEEASQTDEYWLVGGDVQVSWRDLNVLTAFSYGENQRPMLAEPTRSSSSWHVYGQVDYVVLPWLVPTFRYEYRSVAGESADRFSGGAYALVRSNIRAQILFSAEGKGGKDYALTQLLAGTNLAF